MRCSLSIRGRVQGVWYRASLRDVALAHDVTGWVRNRADGSVEAVLEGSQENVQRVIEWCRKGPPGAAVRNVDVVSVPVGQDSRRSFDILY